MNTTNCSVCGKEMTGNWTGNPKVSHGPCLEKATEEVRNWYQAKLKEWADRERR